MHLRRRTTWRRPETSSSPTQLPIPPGWLAGSGKGDESGRISGVVVGSFPPPLLARRLLLAVWAHLLRLGAIKISAYFGICVVRNAAADIFVRLRGPSCSPGFFFASCKYLRRRNILSTNVEESAQVVVGREEASFDALLKPPPPRSSLSI